MANIGQTEDQLLIGYDEAANFLKKHEFRITKARLYRLCSCRKGPPDEGKWGKKKRFLASKVLAWAYARVTGLPGRTRVEPAAVEMMPPPSQMARVPIAEEMLPPAWATAIQPDQQLIDIPDDELPPY